MSGGEARSGRFPTRRPPRFRKPESRDLRAHLVVAAFITLALIAILAAFEERMIHLFLIPTAVCGIVCLSFFIKGLADGRHLLDPRLLVALLGFYGTCVAPLFHVFWDYRILYLPSQPLDYRPWFAKLGLINIAGIVLFLLASGWASRASRSVPGPLRVVNKERLLTVGIVAVVISTALQVYVYLKFGGIFAYVDKYLYDRGAWANMGWLMMVSESAPLITVICLAAVRSQKPRRPVKWIFINLGAISLIAMQFLFGGLRGSRSHLIVVLFYAACLTHDRFRPISRRALVVPAILLVSFTYFYTFFKDWGFTGAAEMLTADGRKMMLQRSGRSFEQLLLSDFNRSDLQAFLLQQLEADRVDFAFGRTYIGTLSLVVPRAIWPDRLPTKTKWTTDLETDPEAYDNSTYRSSRMYGQVGEAVLNFGYFGFAIAYTLLGLVVGRVCMYFDRLPVGDARRLLLPGIVICSLYMFVQDSDNILYFVLKYVAMPALVVVTATHKVRPGAVYVPERFLPLPESGAVK